MEGCMVVAVGIGEREGATCDPPETTEVTMSVELELEFAEPPAVSRGGGRRGSGKVQKFVAALKEHPGTWAIYTRESKVPTASHQTAANPGTQWTVRANKNDEGDEDGTYTVFARFIGEDGEHLPDGETAPLWLRRKRGEVQEKGEAEGEAKPKPVKKAAAKKAAARRSD